MEEERRKCIVAATCLPMSLPVPIQTAIEFEASSLHVSSVKLALSCPILRPDELKVELHGFGHYSNVRPKGVFRTCKGPK
jgi:hypothetical protein